VADRIEGGLRQPFAEQVAFFRGKLGDLVPTARWDDLDRQQHDTAFMVAGAAKADLLAELAAAVDRAVTEGKSLSAFRKDFSAAVDAHDWHGWTGEDTRGGRAWRTRTIYRTNASTSYAAGRRAQLHAGGFKFWVYRHGGSQEPRPEHLALDGLILPADHPAWAWLYPPNGWGCSCYVVGARTMAGAIRLGGKPDVRLPESMATPSPGANRAAGVGKGWDYAPGAAVAPQVAAIAGKIGRWDYQVAKAFMSELPPESRDAISRAYRRLPSVADDLRRLATRTVDKRAPVLGPARDRLTLGMLTADDVERVRAELGLDVDGYDFTVTRDAILHVERDHGPGSERIPGHRGVSAEDLALLPAIVATPDLVTREGESDAGEQLIRFQKAIAGERYIAVFAIGGKKARTLSLKTARIQKIGRGKSA